jgi:hypothetical protein
MAFDAVVIQINGGTQRQWGTGEKAMARGGKLTSLQH